MDKENPIDSNRKRYHQVGFDHMSVVIGGHSFNYFVGEPNFCPRDDIWEDWAYFEGDASNYNLVISRNVPEDFRHLWALHEYQHIITPDSCADILPRELDCVPEGQLEQYVKARKNFFAGAIRYHSTDRGDESLIPGFQKAMEALHPHLVK